MCVALTGTDAGSNALFGNLQKVTAEQLGLSPILMGAANTTGGVMIYNAPIGTQSSQGISLTGGIATLSPLTTGPYAGIGLNF